MQISESAKKRMLLDAMETTEQGASDLSKTDPVIGKITKLYILSEHWRSDIEFFRDELNFLKRLTSRYAMWLEQDENIQSTQHILEKLAHLESMTAAAGLSLGEHLSRGASVERDTDASEEVKFFDEHAQLESQLSEIVSLFRQVRKEIFELTEKVLEIENRRL